MTARWENHFGEESYFDIRLLMKLIGQTSDGFHSWRGAALAIHILRLVQKALNLCILAKPC